MQCSMYLLKWEYTECLTVQQLYQLTLRPLGRCIAVMFRLLVLLDYQIVLLLKFLVRNCAIACDDNNDDVIFIEINISGQYETIQLGNTSTINCSVSQLMNSNIKWISYDGAVVSSSGVLMLFGDHTIDGRTFRCVVNSTQLYSPGERNITVIIKSKFQRYHRKFIY